MTGKYTGEAKVEKKAVLVDYIERHGHMALQRLASENGMSRDTVARWLDQDVVFRARILGRPEDLVRTRNRKPREVPDFETFRRECFGNETYDHQREWLRSIEDNDLSLILVPPEHAKTMTVSIEYATWRIVKDRTTRIIIVSKSQTMSRKILSAIQKRLTDNAWYDRAKRVSIPREWGPFAPSGRREGTWNKDMFYVTGIDSGEKDPTVEALGVGGQIYGARADLIILDDVATLKNQLSPTVKSDMIDWMLQEVLTRLSDTGRLVIVGTRVHESDIYGQMLSEDIEWAHDFEKIVRPAIIDEAEGKVLWPEVWPLEKLITKRRNRMTTRQWNLVYQQTAVGGDDAPFATDALEAAKDPRFNAGSTTPGTPVVVGVDPALTGTLSLAVVAYDRGTKERWLVDIIARTGVRHPDIVKNLIVDTCGRYGAIRCRIEKNAMQGFLSRDLVLRRSLLDLGCQLQEEYTGMQNKYDPEWGVASIAGQFDEGLWHLPWTPQSQARIRPLVDELAAWRPGSKGIRQDRVMSLWLADLSCRQLGGYDPNAPTRYRSTPMWIKKRSVPSWVSHPVTKTPTFLTPGDSA